MDEPTKPKAVCRWRTKEKGKKYELYQSDVDLLVWPLTLSCALAKALPAGLWASQTYSPASLLTTRSMTSEPSDNTE